MTNLPVRLPQTLIDSFADYAAEHQSVALITVLRTDGSTYSKVGGQMLIGADARSHGLLSGGCLENDLIERSAKVIESGAPDWVEYDLRTDDDVFGLGVGCEGAMHLQIMPLAASTNYEPFAGWLAQLETSPVIDVSFDMGDGEQPVTLTFGRPHEVLLLGAGQDAEPLVRFCHSLGWRVTVADHRSAYVAALETRVDCRVECVPVEQVREHLDLDRYDAAIVMSHHLASDRQYLSILADSSVRFVGLLGPPHRRDRLLGEIGAAAGVLGSRLRSPVGKHIGGRGPAAIALEVAAELQEYFCGLNDG